MLIPSVPCHPHLPHCWLKYGPALWLSGPGQAHGSTVSFTLRSYKTGGTRLQEVERTKMDRKNNHLNSQGHLVTHSSKADVNGPQTQGLAETQVSELTPVLCFYGHKVRP